MIYTSYKFSSPHFNILRMARHYFSWSSVSDDLFLSSCSFLVLLLALSFSRLVLSISFLCSSVSEARFALCFSFLSECLLLFFVHAKAVLAYSRNELWVSQVGFKHQKQTLSMRVFGPRNSAYAFWHTVDIQTDTYVYISREISIEHSSVGLASLAQLCLFHDLEAPF